MEIPQSPVDHSLVDQLPARQRLALAYARGRQRQAWLFLFAFDARLAAILRQAREPLLAQIRLSWWRERVAAGSGADHRGEPLLGLLRQWPGGPDPLVALVDAWEPLVAEAPLPAATFMQLAQARAAVLAELAGAGEGKAALRMGKAWALADISGNVSHPAERSLTAELAQSADWRASRLSAGLRPLAVLHALARRDLQSGCFGDRVSPGGLFSAMRAGLLGR